ncbi:MAG TPA: vitamin B12-dependent ribonucleotide reductase [bacterium]|jgi:ribonucleoside-diphosphate reductase alpha chain|nr:vitamin B12-dependent ribonucleotide reductase [bacterium]
MSTSKAAAAAVETQEAASAPAARGKRTGLKIGRHYTKAGASVWDTTTWEKRTAAITNENGKMVFEQKDCEIPSGWSLLATNVVVSKYFRGKPGAPDREHSVKQLIGRVANTFTAWGWDGGYFAAEEDREAFRDELTHILLHQHAAFNSPVWFNVGIEAKPQCSACFINSVEDNMGSILGLAKTEGMLFKHGSGTGTNLSPLRSGKEHLAGGGQASGPVSFMKGFDAFAGVIKSGGKTRRAAKMVILNIDHPDIVEFIQCKEREEKKAWALIDAGYEGSFTGEAYGSVFFQNSNNSVRVTDEFMRAVIDDREWKTRAVVDGRAMDTYRARDLMKMMAESAWICGDPGIQFDTTVNHWHPCPKTARINASNPCSEYMFLDDSACNLASLNLMKFRRPSDREFDVEAFRHACEIIILAQEIIIDYASYPTEAIEKNSHAFRPLGIGYANLGALLMSRGMAYDSPDGRAYAAAITALLSGNSYRMSARVAKNHGPFAGYARNREDFLRVIGQHRAALKDIERQHVPAEMLAEANTVWDETLALGQQYGYKNAQISVLAPTGTIGFMMDCDTTGVEPDISLVKYKKLVGGGMLKIVNQTVPEALERLGYSADQAKEIIGYIDENETIEGAPGLKDEHLSVFDCAFKPTSGVRSIHWMGHLKMMSAVQPFISGALSKTVNMPTECTIDDIMTAYTESWKMGIKALAVYRDGSKRSQPLNTSLDKLKDTSGKNGEAAYDARLQRRRLPDERAAITHKFSIAGHEGYLTVGLYEDSTPGEIFVTMAKEGSAVSGLVDAVATLTSITLQYGVPMEVLCKKFIHTRFEPNGFTNNPNIPMAKSILDYIFRWLELKFVLPKESATEAQVDASIPAAEAPRALAGSKPSGMPVAFAPMGEAKPKVGRKTQVAFQVESDAPPCPECGDIMVRSGSCHKCISCGTTSGCS